MIDFIKLHILNPDIQRIRDHPALEWDQVTNERTGEVKEYRAKFHGMEFLIRGNRHLNISGSLHKFWNSINGMEFQNYNDFPHSALIWSINNICETFDLSPGQCKIENLEFGVNITPVIPPNDVLKSAINHKGTPFSYECAKNKQFRKCEHQRYYIKIYNKGLQYDRPGSILRFENKTVKMQHLKGTEIESLADLLDRIKVTRLGIFLRGDFDEILFYDYTIPEAEVSPSERLILSQGRDSNYWDDLKKRQKDNYYKKRRRFEELVKKYGTQNISETLGELISQKWDELLNCESETLQELTDLIKPYFPQINHSNKGLIQVHSPGEPLPRETPAGITTYTLPEMGGGSTNTPPRRYCLSCKRDITNQRPGSRFCSAKYLGERQAHKCRNMNSNPRNGLKTILRRDRERGLTYLFDPVEFSNTSKNIDHDKPLIIELPVI